LQSGRPMQPRNQHLTLAFIGDLKADAAERLSGAIDRLSIPPFDWSMTELGWFQRARVAWAGGPANAAMAGSVSAVRSRLDELGVAYDRKAFVAHVTLFRDVRAFACSGPLASPLPWRTALVALYAASRDEAGPVYRRVGEIPV
jgi:2'-5' RNA ligase